MKILFLDFDGVLHPEGVFRKPIIGRIYLEKKYADAGHKLFEHAELLVDLIGKSGVDVQIVLSTSWVRVLKSYKKAKRKLPAKLQEMVVCATWHSSREGWIGSGDIHSAPVNFSGMSRYQQIMLYVERHNVPDSDWIAVDDDNRRWYENHRENLVHTDDTLGLGKFETQKELITKLKGEW
jgi:hypothetical protein